MPPTAQATGSATENRMPSPARWGSDEAAQYEFGYLSSDSKLKWISALMGKTILPPKFFPTSLACFCVLLATTMTGCGGPQMAQVTGTVTLNGEPVTEVFVTFQPQPKDNSAVAETRSAMAEVDDQGNFELSTNKKGDGALVGDHKVMVTSVKQGAEPPGVLPPGYLVTVQPGKNEIELKLKAREY